MYSRSKQHNPSRGYVEQNRDIPKPRDSDFFGGTTVDVSPCLLASACVWDALREMEINKTREDNNQMAHTGSRTFVCGYKVRPDNPDHRLR